MRVRLPVSISSDRTHHRAVGLVVEKDALGGAVEVLVLTAPEAPDKATKANEPKAEARRNEDRERVQADLPRSEAG
jgi:hypothetical protein